MGEHVGLYGDIGIPHKRDWDHYSPRQALRYLARIAAAKAKGRAPVVVQSIEAHKLRRDENHPGDPARLVVAVRCPHCGMPHGYHFRRTARTFALGLLVNSNCRRGPFHIDFSKVRGFHLCLFPRR